MVRHATRPTVSDCGFRGGGSSDAGANVVVIGQKDARYCKCRYDSSGCSADDSACAERTRGEWGDDCVRPLSASTSSLQRSPNKNPFRSTYYLRRRGFEFISRCVGAVHGRSLLPCEWEN